MQDINDKLEAPGGIAILNTIGYVFMSEGKKNLGRFLGFEGFMAGVQETSHDISTTVSLISSAVKLQQAHERSERYGVTNEHDEAALMTHGLDTIWKMGKQEIEKNVRSACKLVLREKSTKKKRAQALLDLGTLYKKEATRAKKEKGMEKGTFFDFVQKQQEDDEPGTKKPNQNNSTPKSPPNSPPNNSTPKAQPQPNQNPNITPKSSSKPQPNPKPGTQSARDAPKKY